MSIWVFGKAFSFEGPAVNFLSGGAFTITSTLTSTKKVNPKNKQNLRNLTSVEFVLEIWEGMNLKNKYPKNQIDFKKKLESFCGAVVFTLQN